MPIYEYQCRSCHDRYEYLVRSQREDKPRCPRCGCREARKLISSASIGKSPLQKASDRISALSKINPTNPQEVARYFKERGSRFGDKDFRGNKAWKDAVDRVAEGGPTLEKKK